MAKFEDYANKYQRIRMERRNGILQITFHSDGDTLQWAPGTQGEFAQAFADIGSDQDNKVVIMTGAGDAFVVPHSSHGSMPRPTAREVYTFYRGIKHRLMNLLDIEAPMISAINGPATLHGELPLLCDIVLAAEEATLSDVHHFAAGLVPGDGAQIVYPLLLGLNRGRYFLLTGESLSAHQARELGLVSEVLPRQELLPRAWALAEELAQKPPLVLRYSRVLLTLQLKNLMQDLLGYGFALEGLGMMDTPHEEGSPTS